MVRLSRCRSPVATAGPIQCYRQGVQRAVREHPLGGCRPGASLITEEIPVRVGADAAYRNARENSDRQNARIELDKAVSCVMNSMINDDRQLCKKFADDEGFKRWLMDAVFNLTYKYACASLWGHWHFCRDV